VEGGERIEPSGWFETEKCVNGHEEVRSISIAYSFYNGDYCMLGYSSKDCNPDNLVSTKSWFGKDGE
jgi:hypothetical protein